jgi:hypothetical protein
MTKSAEVNAQATVRCVLCPQCGYSLHGLPDSGICPECGFEYSRDLVVVYGSSKGGRKDITAMTVVIGIVFAIAFASGALGPLMFHHRLIGNFFQPALFLLAAILAWSYRAWLRRHMPAETQLWLSPRGFGMRDGFGEMELTPWQPGHRAEILQRRRQRFLLRITVRRGWLVICQPVEFVFVADEQTVSNVEAHLTRCLHPNVQGAA